MGVRCLHFTPDPYFTLNWKRTSMMDACIPLWDYIICCKSYELNEYRQIGRRVVYMPLGFSEYIHRPCLPKDDILKKTFTSEVGFLGGWEPRREDILGAVADMGIDLKIWGYSWDHIVDGKWSPRRYLRLKVNAGPAKYRIRKNECLANCLQGGEVYGDEYAWAISCAKISIGFLRHVCPDQHTTRTFEIPACKSLLLADRTDEHKFFFEEGKEAEFFSSKEEMLEKVEFYLRNESARRAIVEMGYRRCHESGYTYTARLSKVVKDLGLVG